MKHEKEQSGANKWHQWKCDQYWIDCVGRFPLMSDIGKANLRSFGELHGGLAFFWQKEISSKTFSESKKK